MADPNTKNGKADVNWDRILSSLFVVLQGASPLAELFNDAFREFVLGMVETADRLVEGMLDFISGSFT